MQYALMGLRRPKQMPRPLAKTAFVRPDTPQVSGCKKSALKPKCRRVQNTSAIGGSNRPAIELWGGKYEI